jgi:hypothetical protein
MGAVRRAVPPWPRVCRSFKEYRASRNWGLDAVVSRSIGTLDLPAGVHTLIVKPLTKPAVAVMDLRQVVLNPVGKE